MPETKYFVAEPQPNIDAPSPSSTTSLTLAHWTVGDSQSDTDPEAPPPVLANYSVIIVGMLSGSESSSPFNAHSSLRGPDFPPVEIADKIHLQHALCRALGVTRLAAHIGNSMGGLQAFHMAVLYPDFVERIVVLTGAARASLHNISFPEGPKAALVNSVDFRDGAYTEPADRGTRAFGRAYSTWALISPWFRERSWETLGFPSLWKYLEVRWEKSFAKWDAHDLLGMLHMWQRVDVSLCGPVFCKGDLASTLSTIEARVLLMPSLTDVCRLLSPGRQRREAQAPTPWGAVSH